MELNNKSVSNRKRLARFAIKSFTDKFSRRVASFRAPVTIPIIIIITIPKYSRRCYSRKEEEKKEATLSSRAQSSGKRSRLRRVRDSSRIVPGLFAKFDPAFPFLPVEDRGISITTCMYVGESSKSRRERSFLPCEFRLTLTTPPPPTREGIPLL